MSHARYAADSATSRDGARHANRTIGLRQRAVLNVIIAKHGATIAEIAHELGVPNNEVSGRIAELRDDHRLIVDSGIKRKTVTPCRGVVWVLDPSVAPYMQISDHALNDQADVLHDKRVAPTAPESHANPVARFGPLFGGVL